jgi:ribosomal protein S18 acetylase RimI-like enzyme
VIVRDALSEELAEVGEIRVTAYRDAGFLSPGSEYAPVLRDLGRDGDGTVLVAVDGCSIVGTVMLRSGGNVVTGQDETEIRALAVTPDGQGKGTGSALLTAVIERAARDGVRHLVLLTQPDMLAARRLYERAGFRRLPDRDWSPTPGVMLLAYGLRLGSGVLG